MKAIPQGEALVLFHYMTRSFQDFRERKLARCGATAHLLVYCNTVLTFCKAHPLFDPLSHARDPQTRA